MSTLLRHILSIITAICLPASISAFSLDSYAPSSRLAEGRWVKVSVEKTGLHFISASQLRDWGFSDPSAVKIYGYGGKRISDLLSADNYIDDLPVVACESGADGIVFYAQGPEEWTYTPSGNYYNHSFNPYSTHGFYFLSDSRPSDDSKIETEGSAPTPDATDTYTARLYHEIDLYTASESGHQLLGEDFRSSPTHTFRFNLTDRVEGTPVWMQCDFFATSPTSPTRLNFTVNGSALPYAANDRVKATDHWGDTCHIRKTFQVNGTTLDLGITASTSGLVKYSNLDKLDINYTAGLKAPKSGFITFRSDARSFKIAEATDATRVWDVTDITAPVEMRLSSADGVNGWTNVYTGPRDYAVWNSASRTSLPSPVFVGHVANQNIHAEETPDMVIISPVALLGHSRRIAKLHTDLDGMKVLILTDTQVYNEFGSGCADVGAIRRMLKMFYDRGLSEGRPLGHALLMGGATHDHRRLTSAMAGSTAITLPIWQTDDSHYDSYSYSSDDIMAILDDNSGTRLGTDIMNIGIGRIPARSAASAEVYVKRLESYLLTPDKGEWRTKLLMFADDGNNGDHMNQTDTMEQEMRSTLSGSSFTFNKVYIDAYEMVNGTSEEAKTKVFTNLNDGVILWTYVGHASINALSGDGIFTPSALNNLYLRRPPFFYAACCTFGSFDGSATCGMESLLLSDAGGIIGCFTATRPSLISRNGDLTVAFGTQAFLRNADGRMQTVGQIFANTKNLTPSDNKRRYILSCDPALRLASPENYVRLLSIDGLEVSADSQPVIPALGTPTLRGEICDPEGNRITDFNGILSITLYDAERSFITHGRGDSGVEVVFDEQGERLYAGRARVTDGIFEATISMPAEISDNYRNATLSLYAVSDSGAEASGVSRDLYVYGFNEDAEPDTTPPTIEYLYLNHETFASNDVVNAEPMLIARVSDNVAINMSGQGVGHQMSIRIDDTINLTDIGTRFTPDSDGTPAGTIHYQLPELSAGNHTAMFRVWDTSGNESSRSIDFFVDPSQAPTIFDVYSDANPALTEANFYVSHNRPDATLTVRIEIFDLNGRRVWDSESTGKADMYSSAPITWDLSNYSGTRVTRGIYIYKATVTSGGEAANQTKRIAVAPL